jgi:hypothetical protein
MQAMKKCETQALGKCLDAAKAALDALGLLDNVASSANKKQKVPSQKCRRWTNHGACIFGSACEFVCKGPEWGKKVVDLQAGLLVVSKAREDIKASWDASLGLKPQAPIVRST